MNQETIENTSFLKMGESEYLHSNNDLAQYGATLSRNHRKPTLRLLPMDIHHFAISTA